MVAMRVPVVSEITVRFADSELATKTSPAAGSKPITDPGPVPTATVARSRFDASERMLTLLEFKLATKISPRSASYRTPIGEDPTGIVATTALEESESTLRL